jgi:hypothetical protein
MLLVRVTAEPAQRALAVVAEPLNREKIAAIRRVLPRACMIIGVGTRQLDATP